MAKKPEVIHDDASPGPSPTTVAAMEAGEGTIGELVIEAADVRAYECGIIRPREGIEVVYFGHRPFGLAADAESQWQALRRFQPKQVGSVDFVIARPVISGLTMAAQAGLELAHGRDRVLRHFNTAPLLAERSEFEKAAFVRWPSGTRMLYTRYRGLWFSTLQVRKPHPRYIPPADVPGPGQAFPRIAIA